MSHREVMAPGFRSRVEATLRAIGASADLLVERDLPLYEDAAELALAHVSRSGREHWLTPVAAGPWRRMREAAHRDGVVLVMVSGFRGFDRQLELIRERLSRGHRIEQILSLLAPPGCSEHHTGCAADIGTPGCAPLSESFEETVAFEWLGACARDFGFTMSYPRDNPSGFCYEPWHWCFASA